MKEQDYSFISTPYPIDRKLYKYYSNAEYAVDCIKKRRIHLDDPKTFNDPFDATFSCPRYTSFDYDEDVGKTIENLIEYVISIPKGKQTVHTPQILKHLLNYQANLNSATVIQPKNKTISDILTGAKEKAFSDEEFYDTINDGFIETKRVMHLNCKSQNPEEQMSLFGSVTGAEAICSKLLPDFTSNQIREIAAATMGYFAALLPANVVPSDTQIGAYIAQKISVLDAQREKQQIQHPAKYLMAMVRSDAERVSKEEHPDVGSSGRRELSPDELDAIQQLMAEPVEPATVGNDPELAARAASLRDELQQK